MMTTPTFFVTIAERARSDEREWKRPRSAVAGQEGAADRIRLGE